MKLTFVTIFLSLVVQWRVFCLAIGGANLKSITVRFISPISTLRPGPTESCSICVWCLAQCSFPFLKAEIQRAGRKGRRHLFTYAKAGTTRQAEYYTSRAAIRACRITGEAETELCRIRMYTGTDCKNKGQREQRSQVLHSDDVLPMMSKESSE